ncbi:hypothetical protein [Geopseudomonas aromaticivorans]
MKKYLVAAFLITFSMAGSAATDSAGLSADVGMRTPVVVENTACEAVGMVGTDKFGFIMSCQNNLWRRQFKVKEELLSIAGCHEPSEFCKTAVGAPANTEVLNGTSHGGNDWRVTIGERSFCSIGFFAYGPRDDVMRGGGNFCRVLPISTNAETGRTTWQIRVGSTGSYVGCHALCIE